MSTVKSGLKETTASQMQSLECNRSNYLLSRSPLEYRLPESLSVKTVLHLARFNRILDLKADSQLPGAITTLD